jgi:galactose oxidase
LIAGGGDEDGTGALPLAHIYDPVRDTWRTIDTGIARSHPAAVLLPDTTVALVNGNGGVDDPKRAQIIDPVTESVTTGPPWPDPHPRGYHNVALLLPDARVLVAGGQGGGEDSERPDLRIYVPPYLVGVAPEERPRIVSAPRVIPYGVTLLLRVEGGPVHKVTLVALGSMTHAWDANQRCVELFDGEVRDPELTIPGPRDAHAAPPGDYMLFAMRRDAAGDGVRLIPSVAFMVRVAS